MVTIRIFNFLLKFSFFINVNLVIRIFSIPDEWIVESKASKTKTVSIHTLEPSALDALKQTLFPKPSTATTEVSTQPTIRQKQRRKNVRSS